MAVVAPLDTFELAADAVLRMAGAADDAVDHVINETLGALARPSGADRAYVTVFHHDGTFENSHEWTAPDVVPQLPAIQRLQTADFAYSYDLAAAGQVLHVRTLDQLPPEGFAERDSFGSFGVKSVLQVPILVDGELLGLVGFNHSRSQGDWGDETIERMRLVGRAIGVALSRRNSNERLKAALAAAERASKAKDDLYSRASHELRTPLHAVLGFAELLELDGVEHSALTQIQENGRLLLSMIDDLLELGRLSAVEEPVEKATMRELLDRVVGNLAPVAAYRDVSFAVEHNPREDETTTAATLVRQVMHCIGSVATTAAADGSVIRVSIGECADCPAANATFEYQESSTGQPVGLGLALARSFVESKSGEVRVTHTDDRVRIDVRFSGY
jgi:signal transduction histidine kinase